MYDLKTKNVACDVVAEDVAASNLALAFLDKAVVIAKNPDFTVYLGGLLPRLQIRPNRSDGIIASAYGRYLGRISNSYCLRTRLRYN